MKTHFTTIATIWLCLFSYVLAAQQSNDINQSLQCSVTYTADRQLVVSWLPKADATNYVVDIKTASETAFDQVGSTVDAFFIIDDVDLSTTIEIRVTKQGGTTATDYISACQDYLAPVIDRKLLIVVAASIYDSIATLVDTYQDVLLRERWRSEVMVVSDTSSVVDTKMRIVDKHNEDPLTSLLLLGHVPVPYSGNNAIDGHTPDHRGAWVADAYYADLDGLWTDTFVDNTAANRDANDNVPGDGKFDQNSIPSDVELAVGRVDMSNLPAFADSEVDLTRAYLIKNIAYRTGQFKATRRAIVDNNFNLGEGFAQGAIKSFSGFFDLDSISYGNYSQAYERDYLWTYGAGGGNYRGASGITNTDGLAADSLQTVFTNLFGSYFGDWDVQNNFLRAALASGTTLINAWSGRPVWYWHTMASGATVGDGLLLSQNNSAAYNSTFGKRLTHISLMGDPTLKMYYERPVEAFSGTVTDTSAIVSWADHADADQYLVYKLDAMGRFVRLTDAPIALTSYEDLCPGAGLQTYMVAPVVLESSPSGSYYNEGAGTMLTVEPLDIPLEANFTVSTTGNSITLDNTSQNATSYAWDFGDGTSSDQEDPMMHTYAGPGEYTVTLIASTACSSDTTFALVIILSTDVNETTEASKLYCYPNPASSDIVHVAGLASSASYQIVDRTGRLVQSGFLGIDGRLRINTCPSGEYIIIVKEDINTSNRVLRLVISR